MLYDRHASLVFGLALKILGDPPEAEDLVQEVFSALWERPGFDPARGTMRAYLGVFTRSRAIDRLRRGARRSRLGDDLQREAPPPPDRNAALERISTMECARQVTEALGKLPERQRRTLELAYYRGLSQSEIAAELGAPLGTVKSTVRAGLRSLRNALEHLLE